MSKPGKSHSHAYGSLSYAEKQTQSLERAREPGVMCPTCETTTTPSDLIAHTETRCPGHLRDPGPGSKWISWADARKLGAPKQTLSYWATRGDVRSRGEIQSRQYLLRDVVKCIVQSHRRRKSKLLDRG